MKVYPSLDPDFNLDDIETSSMDMDSEHFLEQDDLSSSNKKPRLEVSLDTEYNKNGYISVQMNCRSNSFAEPIDFSVIVLDIAYKEKLDFPLLNNFSSKNDVDIYFDDLNSNELILTKYVLHILEKKYSFALEPNKGSDRQYTLFVYFYFSLKDITAAFGKDTMFDYYTGKKPGLIRRKSYRGTFNVVDYTTNVKSNFKVVLKDLYGLQSGSLESLISSCGLDSSYKSKLDSYKEKMDEALLLHTELFLSYGLLDCIMLFEIINTKVLVYNNILSEIYNISQPEALFTRLNLPLTLGTIVFKMWSKYFRYIVLKNDPLHYLAHVKQSVLAMSSGTYSRDLKILEKLNECKNMTDLSQYVKTFKDTEESLLPIVSNYKSFEYFTTEYASRKYLVDMSTNNSLVNLSLTSGGRTNNERPEYCTGEMGADIDIVSAYGTTVKDSYLPLGRPRFYTTGANSSKDLTLGDFIHKVVPKTSLNLWKVVVSCKLSFEQDLIFSKIVSNTSFFNKVKDFEENNYKSYEIPGQFALLRKEICNGVITQALWNIISKVSTSQELKEFSSLKVESAAFYYESDRVDSIENLSEKFISDKGRYEFDSKINNLIEKRTYAWYALPLKNLVEPLILERKKLKDFKDPISHAKQIGLKNVVNTLYGILTSRFFNINNVIVSENITSTTRSNVWLMAKGLNSLLSITDGGPCELNNIFTFRNTLKNKKLPGMHVLSYYTYMEKHRSLRKTKLGNINWTNLFNNNINPSQFPDVGDLAKKHLVSFWNEYKIDIKFDIEVKTFFKRASYINKAHYYFIIFDENTKSYTLPYWKIRGFHFRPDNKPNPVFLLLRHLAHFPPKSPLI